MIFKGHFKKIKKTCFILGSVSFFLFLFFSASFNSVLNGNIYSSTKEFNNLNTNHKVMDIASSDLVSKNTMSYSSSSGVASTSNLNFTFNELTLNVANNGAPQSWSSTSIYSNNGFLTVGGDGMTFFENNSFISPPSTGIGFFTGSAWDGHEFLVVGSKYGPNNGVLGGLYNPANDSFNSMYNLFSPNLSTNASLYQTVWNGTSFIIIGSFQIDPMNLMLYSFNPFTGSLVNITNLLIPSWTTWNSIVSVQLLYTPYGIFILIRGQSTVAMTFGEKLGLLANNTLTDLTNYIPSANSVSTNNNDVTSVQNTMNWFNNSLYVANSFQNNTINLFSYNPLTKNVTSYYNQFNGITAFVGALTYLNGYFYISGYNTSNGFPFMYAFNTKGSLINVLTNLSTILNQYSNWIVSSATDGLNAIYITYGVYPNVYFGLITVSGQTIESRYNVIFNEVGLRSVDSWEISLGGSTVIGNTSSISFSEPNGDYFYMIAFTRLYQVNPQSGWIHVNNTNVVVNEVFVINMSFIPYYITFVETGLPISTHWSVNINGNMYLGNNSNTITFTEISGSYNYNIIPLPGYNVSPSSGIVNVNQQSVTIHILFTSSSQTGNKVTINTTHGLEFLPLAFGILFIFFVKRKN